MTQDSLPLVARGVGAAMSPFLEMGAYEELWSRRESSFKSLAQAFAEQPTALPSALVRRSAAEEMAHRVAGMIRDRGVQRFGVRVHRAMEYPAKLRDAQHPIELLYYRGLWNWVETPCVAVVGTRKPSEEGLRRTKKLVGQLVSDGWTIVSGLASGIDAAAHQAAFDAGGRTIGVIGTPISEVYPRENAALQERIAREFLLISQVPVYRYSQQDWRMNRLFFPERNVTMSALTEATIIVEASDTSGTLVQARAALRQGRKLFILQSCFEREDISWPARFETKGAVRVRTYEDVRRALSGAHSH